MSDAYEKDLDLIVVNDKMMESFDDGRRLVDFINGFYKPYHKDEAILIKDGFPLVTNLRGSYSYGFLPSMSKDDRLDMLLIFDKEYNQGIIKQFGKPDSDGTISESLDDQKFLREIYSSTMKKYAAISDSPEDNLPMLWKEYIEHEFKGDGTFVPGTTNKVIVASNEGSELVKKYLDDADIEYIMYRYE